MQPTGSESLVEKWILHKLNIAAKEVNQYLVERNFMFATTSAHNFWLYELCDVYIVSGHKANSNEIAMVLILVHHSSGSDEANDR